MEMIQRDLPSGEPPRRLVAILATVTAVLGLVRSLIDLFSRR
jgi:hypothetical protein